MDTSVPENFSRITTFQAKESCDAPLPSLVPFPVFVKKLRPAGLVYSLLLIVPVASLQGADQVRLESRGSLLTANDIIFSQREQMVRARGDVRITHPDARLVADSVLYKTLDEIAGGENLRFGQPPYFLAAESGQGGSDHFELDDITVYFGDPNPASLNIRARSVSYFTDDHLEAEKVTLRIGRVPVFYFPKVSRTVDGAVATTATLDGGYSNYLGAYAYLSVRTAFHPKFSLGPELAYYTKRGVLVGPGFDYGSKSENHRYLGGFRGGYINDSGELGTDRLERPISEDRYFSEWRHKHHIGDRIDLTAWVDLWSDSEVIRDFRPRYFDENQFSDSFVEGVYRGDDYFISAFMRTSPNDFQIVPERLPEIRFDLPPRQLGAGIYQQTQLSAALLREDDPLNDNVRSDRLDWYFGLNRPFYIADWLTFTPKVGTRITHYQRALAGRDNYTRVLGEIGADLEANAFAVYDYKNELWGINDIRHVVKPRIEYRFTPKADSGRQFIPQIDRRAFATHLEPIDLGRVRNIDELDEIHTLRYGIDNSFQTRHPEYGSVDLLSLYLANDLRFSRGPEEKLVSNIHAELHFTPVYWFRFDALSRVSPHEPDLRELNTGVTITDARFWSLRLGTEFLEDRLEEYTLDYTLRLNEIYRVGAELNYDALEHRFSHQRYTLSQNLGNTWEVHYQVQFRRGAERESAVGYSLGISYLGF